MGYKVIVNPFTGALQLVNISSGGSGVTGIAPTTVTAIATWADTTGTTIQNSLSTIQPGGAIQSPGFLTDRSITTLIQVPSEYSWIAPELEIELSGAIEIEPDGELIIL